MSFEVEHGTAVGILDELVDEETLGVEGDAEAGLEIAVEALAAPVAFERTSMTFLAIKAPMTAPAITMTATTVAIQNPTAHC